MSELLNVTYLFQIFGCVFIGTLILAIKTAPRLKDKMYRRAKIILGVATLLVALGNTGVYFSMFQGRVDVFPFTVLLTAILHVCLFTFLSLIVFHSDYVRCKNIIKHLLPVALFILLYMVAGLFNSDVSISCLSEYVENLDNPIVVIRTLFAVVYLIQIIVCVSIFRRERRIFLEKIDNYFSDSERFSLRWASKLFYEAMLIGVLLLLFCFYPIGLFDMIVNVLVALFYFNFAVKFINFQYNLLYMLPAVEQPVEPEKVVESISVEVKSKTEQILEFANLETELHKILYTQHPYLHPNVTVSDIAALLNISDRRLSHHINNVYRQNFNRWVNTLRIEYAKEQLAQHTQLTFEQLAEQCGFSSKSKFSNVFREITGVAYSEYKRTLSDG